MISQKNDSDPPYYSFVKILKSNLIFENIDEKNVKK